MSRSLTLVPGLVLMLAAAGPARAQGTIADYERSARLRGLTQDKVFRHKVEPHWIDAGHFWYRVDAAPGRREFVLVDAAAGRREAAFDHDQLAGALARAAGQKVNPADLPVEKIGLDGERLRLTALGKNWTLDRKSGELAAAERGPDAELPDKPAGPGRRGRRERPAPPPDKNPWRVIVRDHNLVLRRAEGSEKAEEFVLTRDGKADDGYSAGDVFWSPDYTKLAALRTRAGEEHTVHMVESSPADGVQPKLKSISYPKPGDRLPVARPHLFDVSARKEIPIADADRLFPNAWSIERPRWDPDGKTFSFVYNQRGHQALRLIEVDAATGKARAVIDETSKTFVDYAHKQFLHEVPGTGELIWMSERDGWNHLYLIDRVSGKVKNPITRGPWVVRRVQRVDDEKRQVWFFAGGIRPGQDPYYLHFARVNFDGSGLTVLTEGEGTHNVRLSPDGKYFLDAWSRVDLAPVTELRRTEDGKLACTLETGDMARLTAAGWRAPERFVAPGRDGATPIHGVIHRPTNFDPKKKYPVIEQIYAGPQGSFVPKAFREFHYPQEMAELGFITVEIDGMGTSNRSKAFHDVCWKNLADAGFPDRIAWLKAAAAKEPALDLTRVGLYGGSAGGQSALGGLLWHPEFYRAAAADCGCHDNRMDKVWWNELWMGYPVGPHYAEQSNVTQAHRLRGRLLLTVGELDTNVDPASTMQVVHALIKAGKDFELVVFPGSNHGAGGGAYGARRRKDFFVRHLLGVTPPERNAALAGTAAR